jgi:hypothetical protein
MPISMRKFSARAPRAIAAIPAEITTNRLDIEVPARFALRS